MEEKEALELSKSAIAGDKWALGRLFSLFEDKRKSSLGMRTRVLKSLSEYREGEGKRYQSKFIGFTGAPGVGKSSLIASLLRYTLQRKKEIKIAVLAVDPSSAFSGGSFLGDRHRILSFDIGKKEEQERFFFRSQATEQELGGLSQTSFLAARLLYYLFDWVCIETVGIGQNEIEVQFLADYTVMLLQPASGDQLQFLKAGIMELPDIFVLNKCDQDPQAVHRSLQALQSSLDLSQREAKAPPIPLLRASAHKGEGIPELAQMLLDLPLSSRSWEDRECYYLTKWIQNEFGSQGLARLGISEKESLAIKKAGLLREKGKRKGSLEKILEECASFEEAQLYIWEKLGQPPH